MAEYIVTVTESANWQELHNELVADGIAVVKLKATNTRNTHYNLTTEQVTSLRNDPRVLAIQQKSAGDNIQAYAIQDADFSKTNSNWGLLRHTSQTNNYGASSSDPGGTYDYVLDGTGVDVVIVDGGIQPDHPEFQDANGVSRVKQINWFTESGVSGTQHSNHYTDPTGHGTHVAGTVAGKTYGWAKNANIYSIKVEELNNTGAGISYTDAIDVLKGWHIAKAGSRPTIVNLSIGFFTPIYTLLPTAYIFNSTSMTHYTNKPCTGGSYRGDSHSEVGGIDFRDTKGFRGWVNGNEQGSMMSGPNHVTSVDVEIKDAVDAGIIMTFAADNNSNKFVNPGEEDYNNYLTFTGYGNWGGTGSDNLYYMRKATPNLHGGVDSNDIPGFIVGALDSSPKTSTHDKKRSSSSTGSAVNIYAAGDDIKSSIPTNSTGLKSGTSMASPQIAGMCALLMQAHPDWTPKQVMNWFIGNAQDKMHSTGESTDFNDDYSLLGGQARVAYFPMNGQKPFTISGS